MRDAIKQLAESRSECTTRQTWYSALFSYNYPNSSETLRTVLDLLITARNEKTTQLQDTGLDPAVRARLQDEVSPLIHAHLPDPIVSEKGAIGIKAESVYQFYECDAGRAAVVFVSEILTAVTTELTHTGSIGYPLTTVLASAVGVHSRFLQASKKQVLDDLPI
ncbi:uncharacterized protein SOCEGT47_002280 [Sorangium cellulosum]|uniref:Uncharacterized protein n=1 Tax=Sorangium cellulosum TaxID=56 RepID=A0A4P2PTR0_SORCE|nr:hypothetical protein [Sorangium cellulosum]AUX19776.1 uncharacterized protein SOCEGT47_002280 [Sorangium cellulosum]